VHQEPKLLEAQQVPRLDQADAVREPAEKKRKLVHERDEPPRKTAQQRQTAKTTVPKEFKDLASARRKVSPPPKTQEKPTKIATATDPSVKRKAPKESLNPRLLKKAPATHSVRSTILVKLHGAMKALNEKMAKLKDPSKASLVLTPDELIVMALDEEQKTANENPSVYGNIIKLRIVKLSRMSLEDWEKEVVAHLNTRYFKFQPAKSSHSDQKRYTTNLTEDEEIAVARTLHTEIKGKEQFGYVTRIPTEAEILEAQKGVEAADGCEKCDRCGGRFQVFPGRREHGALASGGRCTYHPGKVFRPPRKATDHITGGQTEAYFPCCNETVGTSAGCTKADNHVFKVSDPKRLAAVLQFEETPARAVKGKTPVTFDCEMGYTTLGLELIRLTALRWPQGDTLLDVLVKPIGEILDLNSRYSGVFPEHFASAIPYTKTPSGETGERRMQVVDSPAAARALLFDLIDPST
ncbi:hypothetical protein F66182_11693, partial [Fusarium sp. NRRL 66182]